jgi:hypothetical protein
MPRPTRNLAGQVFGRWTALTLTRLRFYAAWVCRCECGTERIVRAADLLNGSSVSCGCYRRERNLEFCFKHGAVGTRTYRIWKGMHTRCTNPRRADYKHYGGRGIRICERWSDFRNFIADMGECPPGLTLERNENNGNYEPGNCRWATQLEQVHNQRPRTPRRRSS